MRRISSLVGVYATVLCSLFTATAGAQTKVIDFEDLNFDPNCVFACLISPGYAGLTWTTGFNEWAVYTAAANANLNRPSSGTRNAVSDEMSVISFSSPGQYFNFNSIFLSEFLQGAELGRTDFDLTIYGSRDGLAVYQTSFALSTTTMTKYDLNWADVDMVTFSAIKGRVLADDITITATPEPSTILMLGTGLLALIGVARRSSNAKRTLEAGA